MADRYDRYRGDDRNSWDRPRREDDRRSIISRERHPEERRQRDPDRDYEPAWDRAREAYERDPGSRDEEHRYRGEQYDDRDRRRYGDRSSRSYGGSIIAAAFDRGVARDRAGDEADRGRYVGKGPRNYRRSDDRITEDVCRRLTDDPDVDASEIIVRVENGVVTLTGTVDDRRARRAAEDAVVDIWGVQDVRNDLRVQPRDALDSRSRVDASASDTGGTPVRQP